MDCAARQQTPLDDIFRNQLNNKDKIFYLDLVGR